MCHRCVLGCLLVVACSVAGVNIQALAVPLAQIWKKSLEWKSLCKSLGQDLVMRPAESEASQYQHSQVTSEKGSSAITVWLLAIFSKGVGNRGFDAGGRRKHDCIRMV